MTEKAVTSVAVPEVEGMAQNLAFWRSSGKLKGVIRSSKVVSGFHGRNYWLPTSSSRSYTAPWT